jgi:hypothetical protein
MDREDAKQEAARAIAALDQRAETAARQYAKGDDNTYYSYLSGYRKSQVDALVLELEFLKAELRERVQQC